MINIVAQHLATDGYINSVAGGAGRSHVPLELLSRGQASVPWRWRRRRRPLH